MGYVKKIQKKWGFDCNLGIHEWGFVLLSWRKDKFMYE